MSAIGMSRASVRRAYAAIAIVAGGSLVCIAFDVEYWPLSQYPMYSTLEQPGPWTQWALVGVVDGTPEQEVPVRGAALAPFDWVRLRKALQRLHARPDHAALLRRALEDCLARALAVRRTWGSSRGTLRGLRLYQLEWDRVDPRHAATPERLSRTVLLAEAMRPSSEAGP